MKTAPMSDSKGAAIDEQLNKVYGAGLIMGERYATGKGAGTLTSDTLYKAKQAILAILAQEVKRAREEGFVAGQKDIINHYHHDPEIRRAVRAATIAATTKEIKAGLV